MISTDKVSIIEVIYEFIAKHIEIQLFFRTQLATVVEKPVDATRFLQCIFSYLGTQSVRSHKNT